ncbi:hypothetical protein [Candidatus Chloroploca asiatica]|uniref:Uncharacterized protein n=1 Tax=Candidatus Chloroploca asiatica TaxID=1506545 RepID=A0A2H3KJG2_9CHLR|nr:hypothetical protein [Candidatus Chloroploca asiatica]PDV97308.1 hypothetical protein A9Q02_18980 [Candidatus Chloroploca asiatica]
MQLTIGMKVRAWDDDRACWWDGEVEFINADEQMVEVTIYNGDHPRHPWQAETISVPLDPEFIRPLRVSQR